MGECYWSRYCGTHSPTSGSSSRLLTQHKQSDPYGLDGDGGSCSGKRGAQERAIPAAAGIGAGPGARHLVWAGPGLQACMRSRRRGCSSQALALETALTFSTVVTLLSPGDAPQPRRYSQWWTGRTRRKGSGSIKTTGWWVTSAIVEEKKQAGNLLAVQWLDSHFRGQGLTL